MCIYNLVGILQVVLKMPVVMVVMTMLMVVMVMMVR